MSLMNKVGVTVRYCGHMGTFIADLMEIDGVVVVHAGGPVTMETLNRSTASYENADYWIVDMPKGFWRPHLGMFVLPKNQVRVVQVKKKRNDDEQAEGSDQKAGKPRRTVARN